MGKVIDFLYKSLLPAPTTDALSGTDGTSTSPRARTHRFVPPMDEHSYYVNRLAKRIADAENEDEARKMNARSAAATKQMNSHIMRSGFSGDYMRHEREDRELLLKEFNLKTLKLLDAHHRMLDLDNSFLRTPEGFIRSIMIINAYGENDQHGLWQIVKAFKAIQTNHILDAPDLTKLPHEQARIISVACGFLSETQLYDAAPPWLTDLVMRRPDRSDDLVAYMSTRLKTPDQAHYLDMSHINQYLDSQVQALREGEL